MRRRHLADPARWLAVVAGLALASVSGCAMVLPGPSVVWRFFEAPHRDDAWTPQIRSWQARERLVEETDQLRPDVLGDAAVSGAGAEAGESASPGKPARDLRGEYFEYRAERKRELARGIADWIQREAKRHYIPDGPIDHWATLRETLDRNGDDCDGLELLTFHFLLDLGFREDEVFRAIVVRPSDGQHHMVTFWFEDASDPWVIDPTGAMTTGMPRLSAVPGWEPLKLFGEKAEFTARPGSPITHTAATSER